MALGREAGVEGGQSLKLLFGFVLAIIKMVMSLRIDKATAFICKF